MWEVSFGGIYLACLLALSGPPARQAACGMNVTFSVAVLTAPHPVSLSCRCGFNNENLTSVISIEPA